MQAPESNNNQKSPSVCVFFYGSYIDFAVLAEVDMHPLAWDVACLPAWEIRIAPHANIVKADRSVVWGVNVLTTHTELERLYKEHALGLLGEVYLPQAVLTHLGAGTPVPAMTYVCPEMKERPPDLDYVARISNAARKWGFPDWYISRITGYAKPG